MALTNDFKVKNGLTVTDSISAGGNVSASDGSFTSLSVDTVTINGDTISSTGNVYLDSAGDIILDADGSDILLADGGTTFGKFASDSNNLNIFASQQDEDIVFRGNDGGSTVTALTLNMSDGGVAEFGNRVYIPEYIAHDGDPNTLFGFSGADTFIINTAGTTALTVDSSQNVGIGTTSPTEKLNVKGNIALSGASASAGPHLKLEGTYTTWELENQYTGGATNDMFRIRNTATSSDALVINRLTNNVGIGITDPDQALEIGGGGKLKLSRADNARSLLLYTDNNFATVESDTDPFLLKSADRIQFEANGAERMRIDSSGNVGIGTTNPSAKLHVTGNSLVTGNSTIYGNLSVTGDFTCLETTVSTTSALSVTNTGTGPALYVCQAGAQPVAHFIDANGGDVVIADDGKVGIGTFSPSSPLHICSNENVLARFHSTDANATLYLSDNGTSNFSTFKRISDNLAILENGGNVGIGTTSPDALLDLESSTPALRITDTDSNVPYELKVDGSTFSIEEITNSRTLMSMTAGAVITLDSLGSNTILNTSGSVVVPNGTVGIGTTSPTRKLTIKTSTGSRNNAIGINDASGTEQATIALDTNTNDVSVAGKANLRFYSGSTLGGVATLPTNERAVITTAGNVGIGTTSPSNVLHVKSTTLNNGAAAKIENTRDGGSDHGLQVIANGSAGSFATRIQQQGAGDILQVLDGSTEVFTIFDGGCVSIGATTANAKLDITQTSATEPVLRLTDDGAANYDFIFPDTSTIKLETSTTSNKTFKLLNAGSGDFNFEASNATFAGNINTSGNILSGGVNIDTLFGSGGGGSGDITGVVAGTGLTGGGTTGSVTLNVSAGDGVQATANCVSVDSTVVRTTGDQSIGGTKNFSSCICVADQLRHTGDFDTRLSFGTDTMQIEAGDCSQICLTTAGTVINEEGKSIDFRVEGDTDTHALFVDGSTDRVSVGCSSPTAKFDINQTATTRAFQVFRNVDQANTEALAYFTDEHTSSTQPTVRIRNDGSGDSLQVRKESTAQLHVKSDGKVGIGTDSPAAKLDVVGGHIRLDAGQSLQWDNTHERIEQSDGHLEFFVNNGEAMTLDTNGLGIGTTSPSTKLHLAETTDVYLTLESTSTGTPEEVAVKYNNYSTGSNYWWQGLNQSANWSLGYGTSFGGETTRLFVNTNGNVGIGCSSPTEKLAVAGDGLFTSNLTVQGSLSVTGAFTCLDTTISVTSAMDITNHGTGPALLVNQTGSNDIVNFQDDGTSAFYIEDGGNVGIGCTNPTQKLDVNGSIITAASNSISNGGKIIMQSDGTLDWGNSADYGTLTWDTGYALIAGQSGKGLKLLTNNSGLALTLDTSQNATLAGDLTVSGGDITLGGTGRIQGIDTVSSGTDAANKTYADTKLACAGGTMTGNVRFNDTIKAEFGSGADLQINHDGTQSLIDNGTGNLTIQNQTNDGDIIFKSDDGSGGITEYFRLDGGLGYTVASESIRLADGKVFYVGDDNDLGILHYSNNNYIQNNIGDLIIQNLADDKDIVFKSDDGSGGATPYLTLDGSSTGLTVSAPQGMVFFDSIKAKFGNNDDLQIYHDGTNSVLNNTVGDLQIYNNADDGDIQFISDDGSGGVAEYLRIDGGSANIQAYKDLLIANDTAKLKLGASQDLQIFHNGTHSYVDSNNTGDLYLRSLNDDVIVQAADDVFIYTQGGEDAIIALGNAEVKLYYNNSKKFETTNTGVDVTGTINFAGGASTGNLSFGDSNQLQLGTGNDLRIYHSGTHGFITNNVSGSLYIQSGNSVQIESDAGENMIVASANGAVQLYYNNCSKLQTTCSGIGVCGNALISGHVCATTKSFVIDNPTTDGKLRYSVVEGNEHGVTVRGSTCSDTIELPDEWDWLVEEDSVTAQITPVGGPHQPYIVSQDNKQVVVCSDGCYNYNVYGTRKDVKPLEVNIP